MTGKSIDAKENHRDLGLIIDHNLHWANLGTSFQLKHTGSWVYSGVHSHYLTLVLLRKNYTCRL